MSINILRRSLEGESARFDFDISIIAPYIIPALVILGSIAVVSGGNESTIMKVVVADLLYFAILDMSRKV